ncbi:Arm DNA-binding domain-containing protein [Streptomyces mirabilis]|uniref:Arm DNA-binding domain-containing protein n=1 Tax=Streptomyces mirabilis TaxID=68239 RepID=UPI003710260B
MAHHATNAHVGHPCAHSAPTRSPRYLLRGSHEQRVFRQVRGSLPDVPWQPPRGSPGARCRCRVAAATRAAEAAEPRPGTAPRPRSTEIWPRLAVACCTSTHPYYCNLPCRPVHYRFVVDVGSDPATGKRKQLTRTFGTLREAKVEYARITNRRYEGRFVEPNKITVNEWLDQWLYRKAEDLEESTVYSYTMTLGRVWGKLGHVRLQELTEGHVEAWMRWALREGRVRGGETGTGLGVTSVEMSLARLEEALKRAVARRLVAVNVAQEVVIPRKVRKAERSAKAVVQPWNVGEVHAFVRAVEDDRLYGPLLLSLMILRPAEICGMRWADVDLGRAALAVSNTRTLMGNRTVVEKDTKSLAAEGQLPLPDLVREALTCFRDMQVAEKTRG